MSKSFNRTILGAALMVGSITLGSAAVCDAQTRNAPVAETQSTSVLEHAVVRHRAFEAAIWGMPAVNFERMYQAFVRMHGAGNQVLYWSGPFGWKNQALTPNPNTIYIMPFFDTSNGPVVLEIPAATAKNHLVGSVDDGWQTAIEDVGPAGVDKGKGGKYLIMPPGYKGEVPQGYIPMPSATFASYALLRSNLESASKADIASAVAYAKTVKVYPLSQATKPAPTRFVDAIDTVYDATIPYDASFYDVLDSFVQREVWLDRDRVMIEMLKSLGIEKGKPFKPDAQTRSDLEAGLRDAHAVIDAHYESLFQPPYFTTARWALPASKPLVEALETNYADTNSYPMLDRAVIYSVAYFSAKHLGQGQFYLLAIADKDGKPLDGARTYRLNVPANAPVSQYWSVTAYDRHTHTLIRDTSRSSRGSNSEGLQKNADGSIDLWFSAKAPQGKESNWVPTRADGSFELMFRFYGPEKPLFDKTWTMTDVELVGSP